MTDHKKNSGILSGIASLVAFAGAALVGRSLWAGIAAIILALVLVWFASKEMAKHKDQQ